jgi:hypothetical protein
MVPTRDLEGAAEWSVHDSSQRLVAKGSWRRTSARFVAPDLAFATDLAQLMQGRLATSVFKKYNAWRNECSSTASDKSPNPSFKRTRQKRRAAELQYR